MKFFNKSILIAVVLMASSTYFKAMDVAPVAWGVSERQGVRPTMEDAYAHASLELVPGTPRAHYFGIFDGHGGPRAANYAGENAANEFHKAYLNIEEATNPLMQAIYNPQSEEEENPLEKGVYITQGEEENPLEQAIYITPEQEEENPLEQGIYVASQQSLIQSALEQSYVDMDKKMQEQFTDGTTAVSAVIEDGKLYLAWAGDSRAVVADANGTIKATTVDHKPNLPAERKRIKANGGTINEVTNAVENPSNGLSLGMSRSIGDLGIKKGMNPNIIIPNPGMITVNLQQGDIIILACDGLWDVINNEAAVDFVRTNLGKSIEEIEKLNKVPLLKGEAEKNMKNDGSNNKLIEIARALRDTALLRRSGDNISVMILQVQ